MSNRGQGPRIAMNVRCGGITNQTCLLAFMASAAAWLTCFSQTSHAIQIYVVDSTYTSLTLEVEPNDSIDNVKQKINDTKQIQDSTGIDPASQYLYFGGTLLEEGYSLSDYNVTRNSTLPLVATTTFSSTPLPNSVWNFGVNDMTAGAGVGWTLWQTNDPVDLSSYGPAAITFNVFGYNGLLAGTPAGYDPRITVLVDVSDCGGWYQRVLRFAVQCDGYVCRQSLYRSERQLAAPSNRSQCSSRDRPEEPWERLGPRAGVAGAA